MNVTSQKLDLVSQMGREKTICSICIATYRRESLLSTLLESLFSQDLSDEFFLEIIVVDNDFRQSAEPVVAKYQPSKNAFVKYFVQTEKNISLTRNMAVKNATGEFVLFIDDDEYACPQWVRVLLSTLVELNVDGVFGAKSPIFNETTPKWMMSSELFYGSLAKTGSPGPKYTSNCIIKSSILSKVEGPFDPKYGITGGEDTHLFDRLEALGARFVFCREAMVYEFLPTNRTTVSYLFFKGLRGGNSHTRRLIEFSGSWHLFVRLFMASKGLFYGGVSLLVMVLMFPSKLYRVLWLKRLASNVGRVLAAFGLAYQGYK